MNYSKPAPKEEYGSVLAALVRHLKARVEEFHCATVLDYQEEEGRLTVQFEGFSPQEVAEALYQFRDIVVQVEGDSIRFYLNQSHSHEWNDTIWGGLYGYLCK